jgi:hypothetical protein
MAIQISGNTVIDNDRRFFGNTTTRNFFANGAGNTTTIGIDNNFFGNLAGRCNTSGGLNNFFGPNAGCSNTTGTSNNFFGNNVAPFNTCGNNNNFIGGGSGFCNISGTANNFFGANAGACNTTGNCNNFLGTSAGCSNTTGTNNNFFGSLAGSNNTTAGNNIAIGRNAGTTGGFSSGLINFTTTGNQIVMGNFDHTVACIKISWGVASDIRYKCVWGNVSHGRDFLRNINPIKYSFKDIETGEVTDPRKRYGFSAQEILALEGDDPIIVNTQNPDNYGITHDHIIPILVNAIKELDAENKSILARLEALESPV